MNTFELSKNRRVQELRARNIAAPESVTHEEHKNPPQCFHCGADLPRDSAFQKFHMERVHGLVV